VDVLVVGAGPGGWGLTGSVRVAFS
jgi:hypothetical protein